MMRGSSSPAMRSRSPRRAGVVALLLSATLAAFPTPSPATAGVLSGTVFHDLDNDGTRDEGEPGVPGVVVNASGPPVVTDAAGEWTLAVVAAPVRVRVSTGWYRSQCDGLDCAAGPGPDNDFEVDNQFITVTVDGAVGGRLDVGLLPDWPGGYPIPPVPVPSNNVDVAARLSWIWPSTAGNCYRTADPRHHACVIGDSPAGLLQISNEGTTPLSGISGFIQIPPRTRIRPAVPSTTPGNSPDITAFEIGPIDPLTNRAPFQLIGTLRPAGAAQYVLKARIEAGTPDSATPLLTANPYIPNEMVVTITSPVDPDGCLADPCARGQHDKQAPDDNTDFHGWQVVSARIVATPAAAEFGVVPVGAVGTTTVSLQNTGATATTIRSFDLTGDAAGDFAIVDATSCLARQLRPGSTCRVDVTLDPAIVGERSATMVVHSTHALDATVPLGGRRPPPPTITSVSPTGAQPGATITFVGTNLASTVGSTTVRFTGSSPVVVTASPDGTRFSVIVPADALQGTITVSTDGGSTSTNLFVVRRAPTDITFSPGSGVAGTVVTIRGNNLKGTTGVWFGGIPATFTVNNANQITATVPAAAKTGRVKVTNPWGTASSVASFTV